MAVDQAPDRVWCEKGLPEIFCRSDLALQKKTLTVMRRPEPAQMISAVRYAGSWWGYFINVDFPDPALPLTQ
jgi:hypothetical protein